MDLGVWLRRWGIRLPSGGLVLAALMACTKPEEPPPIAPLAAVPAGIGVASPRLDANLGSTKSLQRAMTSYAPAGASPGGASVGGRPPPTVAMTGGNVSLDFADTDIREVTAQILGGLLHLNYTIDPSVHGTATLRTSVPMSRGQLLPTLQVLLSQAGASLVQDGPLYRVLPAAAAGAFPGLAASQGNVGDTVVPLHYASADDIARALQPFVGQGVRIAAETGSNAILIGGEPSARETLANLVRAFDVNGLANQSLALMPVGQGDAREIATALQQALAGQGGTGAAGAARTGVVRVVPMERINAVLVSAPAPGLIDEAQRVFNLVQRRQEATLRTWHVYFV